MILRALAFSCSPAFTVLACGAEPAPSLPANPARAPSDAPATSMAAVEPANTRAPSTKDEGIECAVPQYGTAAPRLVVAFGLDGPVWGVRELTVSTDGTATFEGTMEQPAPGTRLPRRSCQAKLAPADVERFRRVLGEKDFCSLRNSTSANPPSRWTATLCVSQGGKACTVHLSEADWRRDPKASACFGALEALAQRICS